MPRRPPPPQKNMKTLSDPAEWQKKKGNMKFPCGFGLRSAD